MATVAEPMHHSLHKRRINDLIQESLHEHLQSEPIGFFCECASDRCFDTIWLTGNQYEAARLDPGWSPRIAGH